jgi:type II restriction/modification system DNA methylase subunit YeeA
MNGMDVTRRSAGKWIIDFGWRMAEEEAALFEAPFSHIHEKVKPEREKNNRESYRRFWWRHVEPRQGIWAALVDQPRRRQWRSIGFSLGFKCLSAPTTN